MSVNSTVNSTVLHTGPATPSDFWTSLNAIITIRIVGNSSSQSGAKETGWLDLGRSSFQFNPGAAEDGTMEGRPRAVLDCFWTRMSSPSTSGTRTGRENGLPSEP